MNRFSMLLATVAMAATASLAAAPAQSSVIINIADLAGNVQVDISGSLDLTGATFDHVQPYSTGIIPGGNNWYLASGTTPGMDWYQLTGVTLPFGTSPNYFSPPTSTSGDAFSIWGFPPGTPLVGLTSNYKSGSSIDSHMEFVGLSIAGMTLIPGTYTFNLPHDTITLTIGGARVPEPGVLSLLGLGLAALAALRRRRP